LKRWLPACILAVAGAAWLAWSFPRFHPSARLALQFDGDGYLAQARQVAADHGADLTGRSGYVKSEALPNNLQLRRELPSDPIAQTFPAGDVRATFLPMDSGGPASVMLRPDGRPLEWKLPPAKNAASADALNASETALRQIAGADAANYRMTSDPTADRNEIGFAWSRIEPGPDSPHVRIEASVKNGFVRQAQAIFAFPEAFSKRLNGFPLFAPCIIVAWFVALVIAFLVPISREGAGNVARAMRDRSAINLGALTGLLVAARFAIEWDDIIVAGGAASGAAVVVLGLVLGALIVGLMFYAITALAVLNARLHPSRVRGLRLGPTRAVFSRTVGAELLGGWLCSAALVSIPLAVSALLRAPMFRGYDASILLNRRPVLDALTNATSQESIAVLALFGVLVPLGLRAARSGPLRRLIIAAGAVLTFTMLSGPFRAMPLPSVVSAALTASLMLWLYARFGVLGALSAFWSANILTAAATLLTQPAAGLHGSGLRTLAALGCLGVFALAAAWKGPGAGAELSGESGVLLQQRSRREELLAEFNVARSAQQRMLPSKPPAFAGYTVAASCEPAREVGGDLYDFVRLSDGRWGIGVADVSGKGVPAALYMTLTKGLLCAAAQDSGDPREILMSVNKHLRAAAKKKVFVTMAFGVLDPVERTLEYVRAGHNPVVWRRAAANETRMLASSGIGLGLASPALFARTLATEKIRLAPGDALIFYSDGLTEAMTESLEQFGEERLIAAAARADGLHAAATRDSILGEVRRFLGGAPSQDDLTIAVLRVNADGGSNGR
jgi:serine phosphatase RsbU (regulator of sigma subunit)